MAAESPVPSESPPPDGPAAPALDPAGPTPSRGHAAGNFCAWALSAAIAYVLSPLPMTVAMDLLPYRVSVALEPKIQAVYSPLAWAYDRNDHVREFYDWYEHLLDT